MLIYDNPLQLKYPAKSTTWLVGLVNFEFSMIENDQLKGSGLQNRVPSEAAIRPQSPVAAVIALSRLPARCYRSSGTSAPS
jgi:hypothetical protein